MHYTPLLVTEHADANTIPDQPYIFDDGYLRVDLQNRAVTLFGKDLGLSPAELQCVLHLASRRGQLVPYQELLTYVWGPAYEHETFLLKVYMHNLRYRIERDPFTPNYIREHKNEGYYFGTRSTATLPVI